MENFLTAVEVARCLGVSLPEADRILHRSSLKATMVGGQKRYVRDELLHWLESTFGSLTVERLRNVDLSNASNAGLDPSQPFVSRMLEGRIHPMVPARTRVSLIRSLADLAVGTGLTYDEHLLAEQIASREDIVSTALPNGVAFPHPRDMRSVYMEDDLLILARTASPVPFGAPGGRLTGIFFLLLLPSPSVHLHVLARLNRMIRDQGLVDALEEAPGETEMLDAVRSAESSLLASGR
ncbi:MAG TPA: PTS sugar transporter subunit IIA [Candidatus Fermentibacter sp.]|nr:PTS sugar transporter subunit IIA [Candidatus Fermentibacter sp.]